MNAVATIRVETSRYAAHLYLAITNPSDSDLYVEKAKVFFNGEVNGSVLRITSKGEKISYTGPTDKLPDAGPEDFLKIAPRGEYKTSIELSKYYDFLPGLHFYRVRYVALHGYPEGGDSYWTLKSNEVDFSLQRGV